jgi:hypothetical protein
MSIPSLSLQPHYQPPFVPSGLTSDNGWSQRKSVEKGVILTHTSKTSEYPRFKQGSDIGTVSLRLIFGLICSKRINSFCHRREDTGLHIAS